VSRTPSFRYHLFHPANHPDILVYLFSTIVRFAIPFEVYDRNAAPDSGNRLSANCVKLEW
jgi:hypothetical protein